MAQAKKSTASKNSKNTKNVKNTNKKTAVQPEPKKSGAGYIVTGVIFVLLGVFGAIGYFPNSGVFIGFLSGLLKGLFGWGFYLMPPAFIACAGFLIIRRRKTASLRCVCTLLVTVIFGAVMHVFICGSKYGISIKNVSVLWQDGRASLAGGVVSGGLSELFIHLFSKAGAALAFILIIVIALLFVIDLRPSEIAEFVKGREKKEKKKEQEVPIEPEVNTVSPTVQKKPKRRAIDVPMDSDEPEGEPEHLQHLFNDTPNVKTPDEYLTGGKDAKKRAASDAGLIEADEPVILDPFTSAPVYRAKHEKPSDTSAPAPKQQEEKKEQAAEPFEIPENTSDKKPYIYPTPDLLTMGSSSGAANAMEEARQNAQRLESAFHSFGVEIKITGCTRGPAVTNYEAEIEAGVKLSRLTGLANDIALSLGVSGVRIGAMPDKMSTVGIEVPNKRRSTVFFRELIEADAFKDAAEKTSFTIGKSINGEDVVGNIAKMPHLLVAGTTGSGKSVFLNSLILSILYKASPEEVRFIMVDPKMVEFKIYNDIPHMLVPVVTDVKKAAGALQWAVVEMMKRYRLFSEASARDIDTYNAVVRANGEGETLARIVIILDEVADLMFTSRREVEESIIRIAQMGRAAGMHLVVATQSPRADVITGLMKGNIPSRISFKVSSPLESSIILNSGSRADTLLGNGDMLYLMNGTNKTVRLQAAWVSDTDRENVVEFIKENAEASYSQEAISEMEKVMSDNEKGSSSGSAAAEEAPQNDYDELLEKAVDVIFESGQASVSMLQRRLKLGYSRAARIVDQMEEIGIVGAFEGSKPRQILMTREQWEQKKMGSAPVPDELPDEMYISPDGENR